MTIPALDGLRGDYVARVYANHFGRLAPFDGPPRTTGPERDHIIPTDEAVETGQLAICVNGQEPDFRCPPRLTMTVSRDTLSTPLYVGLGPVSYWLVEDDGSGTVVVTAGWDADKGRHPDRRD